jgi:hypothetical protein
MEGHEASYGDSMDDQMNTYIELHINVYMRYRCSYESY